MIEATTQAHLAQAMQRAHDERAKAFTGFWAALFSVRMRRNRVTVSRWA